MSIVQTKNLFGKIFYIFFYLIPDKVISFERAIVVMIGKVISPILANSKLSIIVYLIVGYILFISGFKQRLDLFLPLTFLFKITFIFHFSHFHIKALLINLGLIGELVFSLNDIK